MIVELQKMPECKIDEHRGFVYLMENIQTGLYKIGISEQLHIRRRAIERVSGCDIRLVCACIPTPGFSPPAFAIEKYLHNRYSRKRIKNKGEWFLLSDFNVNRIYALFNYIADFYEEN